MVAVEIPSLNWKLLADRAADELVSDADDHELTPRNSIARGKICGRPRGRTDQREARATRIGHHTGIHSDSGRVNSARQIRKRPHRFQY